MFKLDARVDGWSIAQSLFYHQCLFSFFDMKIKTSQNTMRSPCSPPSSGQPCMSPPIRKLEMQAGRSSEEPQSLLSSGVCLKKPQIYFGKVLYDEHFWKRFFFFFSQGIFPLELNENCFGSQEEIGAIFSQMANDKSFRNNTCKSMLWLSYIREVFS